MLPAHDGRRAPLKDTRGIQAGKVILSRGSIDIQLYIHSPPLQNLQCCMRLQDYGIYHYD